MRVVLTGSGGMLGHAVIDAFSGHEMIGFRSADLDVTDLDGVMDRIRTVKPDLVIHGAAFTDVDRCESETEKAYLVNGLGARNVAMACEEIKCPLIYISSDYVFNGQKGSPYDEWDETDPINQYGLSKLMGERFVATLTSRFYIVRTSWLYGRNGRNFVDTIARMLSERDTIEVVHDQVGCPTYTLDLARTLREFHGKGYGTYHVTNQGSCSWYEFACSIASLLGLKKNIMPVTSIRFQRPAARPAYSVLGSTMLRLEGIREPRDWREALADYLGR